MKYSSSPTLPIYKRQLTQGARETLSLLANAVIPDTPCILPYRKTTEYLLSRVRHVAQARVIGILPTGVGVDQVVSLVEERAETIEESVAERREASVVVLDRIVLVVQDGT